MIFNVDKKNIVRSYNVSTDILSSFVDCLVDWMHQWYEL